MAELFKFDELRLKTEAQLAQLINSELERGIRCARQALNSTTRTVAEDWNARAQKAYAEASRLIPFAAEMANDDRIRTESKLEHLQAMLQTLATAEDEVAALA